MPYYKYEDFVKACKKGVSAVIPINQVLKDANECFNLKTAKDLLAFIANGGLEKFEFVNTKEWESNPNKSNPIMVDAYEFMTIHRRGYIAFFYNARTGKWIIKSFHLSSQRNLAMETALRNAGLIDNTK